MCSRVSPSDGKEEGGNGTYIPVPYVDDGLLE